MRIFCQRVRLQAHFAQQTNRHVPARALARANVVNDHRFGQYFFNIEARIERRVGILKNNLYATTITLKLLFRQRQQIFAIHDYLARRCRMQAHQCQTQGGFTRTGFTHQPNGFTLGQDEGHIIHRTKWPLLK